MYTNTAQPTKLRVTWFVACPHTAYNHGTCHLFATDATLCEIQDAVHQKQSVDLRVAAVPVIWAQYLRGSWLPEVQAAQKSKELIVFGLSICFADIHLTQLARYASTSCAAGTRTLSRCCGTLSCRGNYVLNVTSNVFLGDQGVPTLQMPG